MQSARFFFFVLTFLAFTYSLSFHGPGRFQAQSQSSPAEPCSDQRVGLRELDFPYYSLREGYASHLYLVSTASQSTEVSVAVYGQHGATVITPVTVPGNTKVAIDLRALLTRQSPDVSGDLGEGSVAVYAGGTRMPVAGQITVSHAALRLVHESEALENGPAWTDIPTALNGIWWNLAGGRDAQIMVANMSPHMARADVYLDYLGQRHRSAPLTFRPHELKVLSITQLLEEQNASLGHAPVGGITIVQRGGAPRLIAQGKIADAATGFSSTMHFPSPQLEHASALHAVGIPVGKPSRDSPFAGLGYFAPHLVMRNLLRARQSVTVAVEYPKASGWNSYAKRTRRDSGYPGPARRTEAKQSWPPGDFTGRLTLPPFTVGSYGTEDVSLDSVLGQLPQSIPYASIRIQYTGPPGSMLAEVSSVEQQSNWVIDAKTQNEGNGWAGSGAYPWHLDKATESYVFLANLGDQPARLGFKVWAEGGVYYLDSLQLVGRETRMIDLRKLRDAQQPDFRGHTIAARAADGSVEWLRLDNVPVMGRLAVIGRHGGLASSYDSSTCKCAAQYDGTEIVPGTGCPITAGSTDQETAEMYMAPPCGGSGFYYNVTGALRWSSSNSNVFTVSNSRPAGLLTGVGLGTATVYGLHGPYECAYWAASGAYCYCTSYAEVGRSTTCSVQAPAYVSVGTQGPGLAQSSSELLGTPH